MRAALAGATFLLAAACAQLPGGDPAPVSAEAQLVTVCSAIAAAKSELARQIRAGRVDAGDIAAIRAVVPVADAACLDGEGDPVVLLERAHTALAELQRLQAETQR